MCFLFYQTDLILDQFATRHQQLLHITLLGNRETEQETEQK